MYPALRRLVARGLLTVEETISRGHREQRLYHATEAGRAAHLDWLRQPVDPDTVSSGLGLGLYVMRFVMMENELDREEVLAFLKGLADALEGFISSLERYVAASAPTDRKHGLLALQHGIVVHQASLEWARSALASLQRPDRAPDQDEDHRATSLRAGNGQS
jgi:DNA-binding PadR family transcriptional regulator